MSASKAMKGKVLEDWLELAAWAARSNCDEYGDIRVTFAEMAAHAGVSVEAVEARQYDIAREMRGFEWVEDLYQGDGYFDFTKKRMWYE